jgi:hypothetical protein
MGTVTHVEPIVNGFCSGEHDDARVRRNGLLQSLRQTKEALAKFGPQAAQAGETACPTIGTIGLARVAPAVSPALVEFCKYL